ncbi:MAG: sensor domain-containing diguanylate cyclase [Lachnospiraceae bacterium]|nr:sensor domain-containing diguanylate cyclase [Lachnospiraceae bacterium]
MFEKARYKYRIKCLKASLVLLAVVLLASLVYIFIINAITRRQVYDDMLTAVNDSAADLEHELRADRSMLRIISKVISESGESLHSLKVTQYLNIYDANSRIADVAILIPGNKVIRVSGMDISSEGVLDFDEIDERGEHISTLLPDLETEGVMDIRSFVPIRREGDTIGYIYSTVTPENVIRGWLPEIYNGNGYISVIDRESGVFLLDSRGMTGRTIQDFDSELVMIRSEGSLEKAVTAGEKGYAIGREKSSRTSLYMCYIPMDIENWEMMITVPQRYVYESVSSVRTYLYIFLGVLALLLIGYFVHILRVTSGSIEGVERRANMDALTRLQNRNRYEYFVEKLAQGTDGLACMYFDVNGLHEMNNTQGHTAGDKMLKDIADILREEYGDSNTYRIGGDEFVTFRYDRDEALVRESVKRVEKKVTEAGYHVACGMAMATPDKKLNVVIKQAETEMYANKERYYRSIGREMRK